MILYFIIIVSLVQYVIYFINSRYTIKFPDSMLLFFIVIAHFFLFPKLFYPKLDPDEINCGLPMLGVTLSFWVFGTLASCITHMLWKLKNRSKRTVV